MKAKLTSIIIDAAASLAVVSASLVAVSCACLLLLRSGYKLRH